MRQRVIGNGHEVRDPAPLVAGRDDTVNRRPAARGIQNTITRRNMHDGSDSFSPANNNPQDQERFASLKDGYASITLLSNAMVQAIAAPLPPPRRTLMHIAEDYERISTWSDRAAVGTPHQEPFTTKPRNYCERR